VIVRLCLPDVTGVRALRRAAGRLLIAISLGTGVLAVASPAHAQPASRRPQGNADRVRLVADLFFRAVADEHWERAASMVGTR
jgi:hypothetical protein